MKPEAAITVTHAEFEQLRTFSEQAVRSDQIHRTEIRRLALAHAVTVEELAVIRMALSRKDVGGALSVVEALMRHSGAHAINVSAEPLPAGVTDDRHEATGAVGQPPEVGVVVAGVDAVAQVDDPQTTREVTDGVLDGDHRVELLGRGVGVQ